MGMYTDLKIKILAKKDKESLRLKEFIDDYGQVQNSDNIGLQEIEDIYFNKYKSYYPLFSDDYRASMVLQHLKATELDDNIIFENFRECSIKNYTNTYEKFYQECIKPLDILSGEMKELYEEYEDYKYYVKGRELKD